MGKRVGQNEAIFREVNERLRELGEGFSLVTDTSDFVCECADAACTDRIQLSLSEYEEVRSDPKWFFVVPGHELVEFERVIAQHGSYLIVEKLPGGPAGIAIREDPRAS
jgi:hypothetical protein